MWGIGGYAQDEWKATHNLKLTFALRLEHNSNPVCQINCFANTATPFLSTPSALAGNGIDPVCDPTVPACNVPYSSDIKYGQHNAFPSVEKILPSPRIGFSWDPLGKGKTVLTRRHWAVLRQSGGRNGGQLVGQSSLHGCNSRAQ